MHAWEAIQKSVDYIENNLTEEIPIDKLAETANLSPFYFQRLFSRLVKRPVCEYIKLRRLAQAVNDLKVKNSRILDIALDYGFSSHASFTRAFKETYGITPDEYRITGVHLNQFVKPELVLNYVMVDENVPLVTDGIVLEVCLLYTSWRPKRPIPIIKIDFISISSLTNRYPLYRLLHVSHPLMLGKGQGKGQTAYPSAIHQKNDRQPRHGRKRPGDPRGHPHCADGRKRLKQHIRHGKLLRRHNIYRGRKRKGQVDDKDRAGALDSVILQPSAKSIGSISTLDGGPQV